VGVRYGLYSVVTGLALVVCGAVVDHRLQIRARGGSRSPSARPAADRLIGCAAVPFTVLEMGSTRNRNFDSTSFDLRFDIDVTRVDVTG